MKIQLSDHFTYKKLLKFTFPSIVMMVFTSIYGVVDGFFVSNFAGKTPFAAVNFITPFLMILGAFGFMFGTGGSALVSKTMGEGNREKANRIFSLLIYVTVALGVLVAVLGIVFIRPITKALGAEGRLLDDCVVYGRIILIALPACMLQYEFQSFFVAAEKPQTGLWVTAGAGITNILLDGLFVGAFGWGLVGAAVATALSQVVGGVVPLLYFFRKNTSLLHLGKTEFDGKSLFKTCTNGSSELLANVSMSLVGMLYNMQLMRFAGEDGVAAYGVLMYVNFIFISMFIGYVVGLAPVVSYHFGAKNYAELKNLRKKSLFIISVFSIIMFFSALVLAKPLSLIFVSYDKDLLDLTVRGFYIFSFSFLFTGIAIFGSSFFTALNNGLISAVLSFLRTLVFQVAAVLLLPLVFGIDGIWYSCVVAELMAAAFSVIFLIALRKKYKY